MFDTILPLLAFLTPLAWSPGPGNMCFAALGARHGLRTSIPATTGYHVATFAVTLALGAGFLEVLLRAPALFTALRYAGVAYMGWLAWAFLRAGAGGAASGAPRGIGFGDGAILLILNPKAYLIIALMFSQFLTDTTANPTTQLLLVTTVFTLNNLAAFTLWTLGGQTLARIFRTPRQARGLNLAFGGMLAATAVWMLVG